MSVGRSADLVRVRRQPSRGRYDRASIDAVLDSGLVAHVAFVHDGMPFCLPMLYARVGDAILIHGARSSRAIRTLAQGAAACVTVTVIDGLVLARSAFEHSANYRSVVLLGSFASISPEEELGALEAFTNKLVPGRWQEVRKPAGRERRATAILALPITTASVKTRTGPPTDDDSADAALEIWAGVVPLVERYGTPTASPRLRPTIPLAPSVERMLASNGAPGVR